MSKKIFILSLLFLIAANLISQEKQSVMHEHEFHQTLSEKTKTYTATQLKESGGIWYYETTFITIHYYSCNQHLSDKQEIVIKRRLALPEEMKKLS